MLAAFDYFSFTFPVGVSAVTCIASNLPGRRRAALA